MGIEWCHAEAFGARLAATHMEGPAQAMGEEYGYLRELCSYARTTLGCAVLTRREAENPASTAVADDMVLASRLPAPDLIVNAYAGCSTGQQWDEISYRIFDKSLPFFKVSYPLLWGNQPDFDYIKGEEWEAAARYVADQLRQLIAFLEHTTGRAFDWEKNCARRCITSRSPGNCGWTLWTCARRSRPRPPSGTGSPASPRSTSCPATRTWWISSPV
ncbi:2-hydroxyacyl-CoA dehydratase [Novosphingobium colocasiae]